MLSQVTQNKWLFVLRGVASIIFGIAALVWPGPTLEVLVYMFGALAFTDGVFTLVTLARGGIVGRNQAWAAGISGVLGIGFAIVTLFWPGITAMTLLYLVAFWAISTGVLQIVSAIEMRKVIEGEGWLIAGGVLSVVFGTLLIVSPGAGLLSLVYLVAFYAILFGFSSLGTAFWLFGLDNDLKDAADEGAKVGASAAR